MNIVLVIDQFDNGNNGTTITARRYAEQLRRRGHHVTILAGGEAAEGKICAPVHKIPVFQPLVEKQGFGFAKPDEEAYYQAFRDADVVHFYLPFRFCRRGEEIARQMHVPTVAAFHMQPENVTYSIGMGKSKRLNDFLYHWCYRKFYNRFRYIHCPSEFIAGQLKTHGYDAELRVISNGVDPLFRPVDTPRPPEFEGKFVILMVGRLSGEKRQDLIIEAAKKSRYADKIQLVFAGKGPKEKEYRRLSAGLAHPPVIGFYGQEELLRLLNSCDLYVHASDAEIEGISCMEALACGLVPVIANSPLSATPQFALDDRSLFQAGNAGDLADKIDYWIEHPEERAAQGRAYAARGDEMRVDACVARAEDMYREAIHDCRFHGYKPPRQGRLRRLTHPDPDKANQQFYHASALKKAVFGAVTNFLTPLLLFIDGLFFGLRVEGRRHLRGIRGGAVTVMNHVHPMDCTMAKIAAFPHRQYFVSLRRNLELPFTGWLVKLCGGLPLPPTASTMVPYQRHLEQAIRQGDFVHFYPEGLLVRYHKGLRPFHGGAFLTAARAGCPIVPMAVVFRKPTGLRALFRRGDDMTLRIGEPLYPNPALGPKAAAQALQLRTRYAMEMLLGDSAGGYPLPATDWEEAEDNI